MWMKSALGRRVPSDESLDAGQTAAYREPLRAACRASSSQLGQLHARAALRLAASPLHGVDRLPARVGDRLDAAGAEQLVHGLGGRLRLAPLAAVPPAASSSRRSTVSVASFLFVPITPLGPRLIQPAQ